MKINKKGFTLIELLVVIAIIGLISTIAVVSFTNVRKKSRNSTRVANMKQIAAAMELAFAEWNAYDTALTQDGNTCDNNDLLSDCTGLEVYYSNIADMHDPLWRTPDNIPCQDNITFAPPSSKYCDYTMSYIGDNDYAIYFYLESGSTGDLQGPGVHEISPAGFGFICDGIAGSEPCTDIDYL